MGHRAHRRSRNVDNRWVLFDQVFVTRPLLSFGFAVFLDEKAVLNVQRSLCSSEVRGRNRLQTNGFLSVRHFGPGFASTVPGSHSRLAAALGSPNRLFCKVFDCEARTFTADRGLSSYAFP